MPGNPTLHEYAWLEVGPERDPARVLFTRLEQRQDGSGIWTVELADCQPFPEPRQMHEYPTEELARARLTEIYRLRLEGDDPGRWRITTRPAE